MKGIVSVILMLFCVTTFVQGQDEVRPFKGGLCAGIAASQIAGDQYAGFRKAGPVAGVWVSRDISSGLSMQMELKYIQKGSKSNPDSLNNFSNFLIRLNYVELPVLVRYHYNERFVFEGGLAYSYLVSAYQEIDYQPYNSWPFRKHNMSGLLGVGYHIQEGMEVMLRYNFSVSSIRENEGRKPYDRFRFFEYGQFNDVLTLSLFYQL